MPAKITQEVVDDAADQAAEASYNAEQAEKAYSELHPTTNGTTALTTTGDPVGMTGEADPSDFVIPYVKLVQATSETGTAGKFLSSTGEEKDHINFVCLAIARTRTFYDGDAATLHCSSNDRRTGRVRAVDELLASVASDGDTLECVSCPHYRDDQFSKNACKLDYALTLYDLDTNEPFLFRVKGSAMGVFRYRLISPVAMGRKPAWFAEFEMTSLKKTNERKQSWFTPDIKPIQMFNEEKLHEWAGFAGNFERPTGEVVDADDLPFE